MVLRFEMWVAEEHLRALGDAFLQLADEHKPKTVA
jgi:hypothetical protein